MWAADLLLLFGENRASTLQQTLPISATGTPDINHPSWVRRIRFPQTRLQVSGQTPPCPLLNHCSATRIGTSPLPACLDFRAFPITAPNAFVVSVAFIANPGVGDVVSRSPTSIGEYRASTLQ